MKFKAVIFDLDGVLVSTDEQHYQGWKALCDRLGIPFDREVNNRFRGVSRMACVDILEELSGQSWTDERKQEYATWKNERYRSLLIELSPASVTREVRETLDRLRAGGLLLAVGSSSKNAGFILERIGLGDYFDAVSDGNNISRSKPYPEVFQKAAQFLGVPPELCLVVEDAVSGVEAAHNAGMLAASLGDAAKNGAGDYVMSSFGELQKITGI